MDKKIFINYVYNILYQIVKLVLPFFLVPYTMGHLGESILGISDFANNIAAWFILFGILGVNTYGNREIAKVRDNKDNLSKTFFEIFAMQLVNTSIALVCYIAYTYFFVKSNQLIYYLICMTIFSSALDISWFYFGVENFRIVSLRNTLVKIVGVALIFILVKTPEDLWKFVVINSCTDLIGQILTFIGLKKYIHKVHFTLKEAYKNHLFGTFVLFVPTIAINVYTLLDQTMLGVLIEDKGQVTLYKTAQSFVKMFLYFITSIGSVVMPRIANTFATTKDRSEVNKYINTTFKLAIIISIPMMVGMIMVSPNFFPWYLPKQTDAMTILVQVASPIIVAISISNVFGIQYLVPVGKNKEYSISVISGAVVNFIANSILIPKYAGVGACIGSIIAEFTVTIVQWFFVRNELKIHALGTFMKVIIASIAMGVVVYFVGDMLGSTIVANVLQAASGVCVYGAILLLLKEETMVSVLNKVILKKNNEG